MINLLESKAIWLVPESKVGEEFGIAVSSVCRRYIRHYPNQCSANPVYGVVKKIQSMGVNPFRGWVSDRVGLIMQSAIREGASLADVPDLIAFSPSNHGKAVNFFRFVFLVLWIRKKVLLPLEFTAPISMEDLLDEMVSDSDCRSLQIIRSVNLNSSLHYAGAMSEKARELRQSHWYRLLLSTTAYNPEDLSEADMEQISQGMLGPGNGKNGRYYPRDFALSLCESQQQRQAADTIFTRPVAARASEKKKRAAAKIRTKSKLRDTAAERSRNFLISKSATIPCLIAAFPNAGVVRSAFRIENVEAACASNPNEVTYSGGYNHLPNQVRSFCKLLNSAYSSFVRSESYQSEKNAWVPINFLLCYTSIYLSKFFNDRDGNLLEYPRTLNDFSCELFVAGDHNLVDDLLTYKKQRPATFITYLNEFAATNNWSADTLYARIKFIDKFFDYIVKNSLRFANSDQVINTINPSCYPKLKKRYGTVKKPIPRGYFSTFISMLYSLEYLAMHLNEMADGTMPGILSERLCYPTETELMELPEWSGIWGFMKSRTAPVDLNALNYTPIFYYNQKPKRFEYIPRFYRSGEIEIEGRKTTRIIMNDIRLTLLMCETGIRQKHLIWLDRDEYDKHIDRQSKRALLPLYVTTDKSHSSWSAITSRRVIEILDRQSQWYDRCSSPEFKDNLWYDGTVGSAFGQFRPLFRLSQGGTSWTNYNYYPCLLLCLQYFIRMGLKDTTTKELVYTKNGNGRVEFVEDYDHDSLADLVGKYLTSEHTPHGLRAGFVSEAIKFLPPFLVGMYLTGQTEELVYYYAVHEDDDPDLTFEQLLAKIVLNNHQKIADGLAPSLTNAIIKMNQKLKLDIEQNPSSAIETHRLYSLERAKNREGEYAKNGTDLIRLKEATSLAFNSTHICPFGNSCPKEAIAIVGGPSFCAGCPFAIRGAAHLPAISAQKDRYKELMLEVLGMISEIMSRKPEQRNDTDLERLEGEHDHFASQALLLEAVELQLVEIANLGEGNKLVVQRRGEILQQYKRFGLPQEAQFLKRIGDAQALPDLTSPVLDGRIALMRMELLMDGATAREKIDLVAKPGRSPTHNLVAQISSMVGSGAIDAYDVYEICAQSERRNTALSAPTPSMSKFLA